MNYYDEELQRLQQEMMEKERADAKPVSYTHLDVYKRQAQRAAGF